jgi:minor extracellular serine protease Vpr
MLRRVGIFLAVAAVLPAQVVPGRYVVELSGEPAMRSATSAVRRQAIRLRQLEARRAIAQHGGTVLESMDTVVNALIVTIPDSRAAELAQIPGAVKIHTVRRVRPLLNYALPMHQVPQAWAMLPLGQDSAGAGIKIAIIDTGIDVHHPSFAETLPAVPGFPKVLSASDTRLTNAKIIVARNYTPLLPDRGDPDADDRNGHGTGTALAAAGSYSMSPFGPVTGVAPKAYIGNYKVLGPSGGTSDIVAKAIDDAVADGMDVINLSLGGIVLSYEDISLDELGMAAIEAATRAGVTVAAAAGNDGPDAGTMGDYASSPSTITMGAIHNSRLLGYGMNVTGVGLYQAYVGAGGNPRAVVRGTLLDETTLDSSGQGCGTPVPGSAAGRVLLVLRGGCYYETKSNNAAAAGAAAIVIYNNSDTDLFRSGGQTLGAATLPTFFLSRGDGTDLKAHLAAGKDMMTTLDFSGAVPFPTRTDLTVFSSRGPALGSALKPDLVAVGDEMVTGTQRSFSDGEAYDPSGYIVAAGTSFSAPLAAGSSAVLRAARPGLTVAQYRSLLVNSGTPASAALGVPATVSQSGAGVLNLAAALTSTIAANPTALNFGTGAANTMTLSLTNLRAAGDSYSLTAVPQGRGPAPVVSATSMDVPANGTRAVTVSLNGAGLATGEYQGYIQIAAASGTAARVPYWFAVPGVDPANILILYQDQSEPQNQTVSSAVIFRVLDQTGLPYNGPATPTASVAAGPGAVRPPYRLGTIPGTYAVDVVSGTGSMQLAITIAGLTSSVVIPVYF